MFEEQLEDGFSFEFIENYRKVFYFDPNQMRYDFNLQSLINRYDLRNKKHKQLFDNDKENNQKRKKDYKDPE